MRSLRKLIYKSICIAVAAIAAFGANSYADENTVPGELKSISVNHYSSFIKKLKQSNLKKETKVKINSIKTTAQVYEYNLLLLSQLRESYKNHAQGNFQEALKAYDDLLASSQLPNYFKSFILRQKPLAESEKPPKSLRDYLTLVNSTTDPELLLTYNTEALIIDNANFTFRDKADTAAFSILKQSISNHKAGKYTEAAKGYDIISNNILLETRYINRAKELKSLLNNGTFKALGGMVIVLDAGHNYGGNAGAFGNGYSETELNMQVVQKLKVQLEAQGARVILTRNPGEKRYDDSSIELPRRAVLANNSQADLFISIHHDSSTNKYASGSSAFYSSYKNGINNSSAYVLVEQGSYLYNSSTSSVRTGYVQAGQELKFISQSTDGFIVNYNGKNVYISNLYSKIISPSPSFQSILSRNLAVKITPALSYAIGTKDRGVGDRNLFVTKNTKMASTLVEIGFISNYSEITRISTTSNQLKASNAITKAVIAIFGA